jgi:hypothetical protein
MAAIKIHDPHPSRAAPNAARGGARLHTSRGVKALCDKPTKRCYSRLTFNGGAPVLQICKGSKPTSVIPVESPRDAASKANRACARGKKIAGYKRGRR